MLGQREPDEHAAFRFGPGDRRREEFGQCRQHRLALVGIQFADGRDVLAKKAVLDHFVHHHLRQLRGVQIGGLLGLLQLAHQRHRRHHVAEADAGRQHLGERAHVDDAAGIHGQHLRQRFAAIAERAIRVVFNQRQPESRADFDQGGAAFDRQAAAGRVLEIRQCIQHAGALPDRAHGFRQQAVIVGRYRYEFGAIYRERLQRTEITRGLDQHLAAFVDQDLAEQIEALLRTGGHQDLIRHDLGTVSRQRIGNPFPQRQITVGRSVLQRDLALAGQHTVESRLHAFYRKRRGRRQAAGERNDFRTHRDLQDFADDRALQLLRALGEVPLNRVWIFNFHDGLFC